MGSETHLSLPVIDLSKFDLNPETPEWDSLKSQVWKAVEEYGCFKILFNVPVELRKGIFSEVEDLFNLPSESKMLNSSEKPFRAYIGGSSLAPLYESVAIDDPLNLEKVDSLANAFWPQGKPSFSNTIQSMSKQISTLDKTVRRMIVECLGLEKYLEEHMQSTNYVLRVMKYEGPQTTEPQLGLNVHTDKNLLTILYQNGVDGLEVQTKDGEWIEINLSPDSFIVFVGDSFHAWTNGRLHAPWHRVNMTGNEARYSAALFSSFREGYTIKIPEELVDEQHPLLFKPFDYFEYLHFFQTEVLKGAKCGMKDYCGA